MDKYPYAGHGVILGKHKNEWQSTEAVLAFFSDKSSQARRRYHEYVATGVNQGRQPGLIGGWLIRSAGGWAGVQMLRKAGGFQKSDERILGDGDFVESVLAGAGEEMARKYALKAKGVSLDRLQQVVAALTTIRPEELIGPAKVRKVARARILFCYWVGSVFGFFDDRCVEAIGDILADSECCRPKRGKARS